MMTTLIIDAEQAAREELDCRESDPTATPSHRRPSAKAPTPSLRPFNQARSGPLGVRQEKRQQGLRNAT
jgi:hypothetical protein